MLRTRALGSDFLGVNLLDLQPQFPHLEMRVTIVRNSAVVGQGGLACCSPWGLKESDTTERLNWTELNTIVGFEFYIPKPKFFIGNSFKFIYSSKYFSYIFWISLSQELKRSEFYPTWKLTIESASFMGTGRRYDIPGSETKDNLWLIALAVARVQHLCLLPEPWLLLGNVKRIRWYLHMQWEVSWV